MQNFNCNFYDFVVFVLLCVEDCFMNDVQCNFVVVCIVMCEVFDEQKLCIEFDLQCFVLQKLLFDVDIVFDLYCDSDVVMYFYMNFDFWEDVELLVCYFDVQVLLFVLNLVGNLFDEIYSFCWLDLCSCFGDCFLILNGVIFVMVELCSECDVLYEFVEKDVQVIVEYLIECGVVEGMLVLLLLFVYLVMLFVGIDLFVVFVLGVIVFCMLVGVMIEVGQVVVDIVDLLIDCVVMLKSSVLGVLYVCQIVCFVMVGMEVVCIVGVIVICIGLLLLV